MTDNGDGTSVHATGRVAKGSVDDVLWQGEEGIRNVAGAGVGGGQS